MHFFLLVRKGVKLDLLSDLSPVHSLIIGDLFCQLWCYVRGMERSFLKEAAVKNRGFSKNREGRECDYFSILLIYQIYFLISIFRLLI